MRYMISLFKKVGGVVYLIPPPREAWEGVGGGVLERLHRVLIPPPLPLPTQNARGRGFKACNAV